MTEEKQEELLREFAAEVQMVVRQYQEKEISNPLIANKLSEIVKTLRSSRRPTAGLVRGV